jgi:hypothetical protein
VRVHFFRARFDVADGFVQRHEYKPLTARAKQVCAPETRQF